MAFVFDHLIAVVLGAAVLMALLTIQTRDRTSAMRDAINGAATSQATSLLDVVSQDLDNAMSEALARDETGDYRCRLERSGDDARTTLVEIPVYVRAAPGAAAAPAHVRYTLVAEGRTVRVGTRDVPSHELRREVDTGAGYGAPQVVGRNLTDFDVTFRGRASNATSGAPPLRFTSIAIALDLALPTAENQSADQASTSTENRAHAGVSIRPPNLTTGV